MGSFEAAYVQIGPTDQSGAIGRIVEVLDEIEIRGTWVRSVEGNPWCQVAPLSFERLMDVGKSLATHLRTQVVVIAYQSVVDSFAYVRFARNGRRLRHLQYGCFEERVWEVAEGRPEPWEEEILWTPDERVWAYLVRDEPGIEQSYETRELVLGSGQPGGDTRGWAFDVAENLGFPGWGEASPAWSHERAVHVAEPTPRPGDEPAIAEEDFPEYRTYEAKDVRIFECAIEVIGSPDETWQRLTSLPLRRHLIPGSDEMVGDLIEGATLTAPSWTLHQAPTLQVDTYEPGHRVYLVGIRGGLALGLEWRLTASEPGTRIQLRSSLAASGDAEPFADLLLRSLAADQREHMARLRRRLNAPDPSS